MLKRLIIFLLILSAAMVAYPQRSVIDSLSNRLTGKGLPDTTRIQLMSSLALQYQYVDVDSMKMMAREILKIASRIDYTGGKASGNKLLGIAAYIEEIKDTALYYDSIALYYYNLVGDLKGVGAVYNNMAVLYHSTSDYSISVLYYEKSLEIRERINDQKGISDCHANLANNYSSRGLFEKALYHALKGLEIRKRLNNEVGLANSYMVLGDVYQSLGEYKKSGDSYRQSLAISARIGNLVEVGTMFNNLGGLFFLTGQYDSAIYYFNRSLEVNQGGRDNSLDHISLTNLGETYVKKGDYKKAMEYYNKAMVIAKDEYNKRNESSLNFGIAQVFFHQGKTAEAIKSALKGLKLSQEINDRISLEQGTKQLSEYYEEVGDYRNALNYSKLSKLYHDSLFSENSMKKIKEMEYAFEIGQREQQISMLEKSFEAQSQRNRLQQFGIISLVLLLVLASFTTYTLQRNRKEQQKSTRLIIEQKNELARVNEIKNKMFSILGHDLRSPVAAVSNLLMLYQEEMVNEAEFRELSHKLGQQVTSLSMLLDNLLNWSKAQFSGKMQTTPVNLKVKEVVKKTLALFHDMIQAKHIETEILITGNAQIIADSNQFDLIVRNLLSNAIKYTPENGRITFALEQKDTTQVFSIIDTGKGMNKATLEGLLAGDLVSAEGTAGERGTGLGFRLVQEFAVANHAALSVKSEPGKGTTVELAFLASEQ